MNCDECAAQLSAYLDDELSDEIAREVESHLRGCADCRRAEERLLALSETLTEQLPPLEAPELLRARIRGAIHKAAQSEAVGPTPAGMPLLGRTTRLLATAALLVLAVAGTWRVTVRRAASDRVVEEILAGHIRSLIGTHLTDVATSDQHTVKPWFNGKLDYSPPVYDFAGQGYPLIGGRLDYVAGRQVAALVYGRRQHLINVFVSPADRDPAGGPAAVTRQGYHLLHWTTPDYSYWVVSDLGGTELDEFAQLVRQADRATAQPPAAARPPATP